MSKSNLAIELSKLKGFASPKVNAEQYETDSETAADVIWLAYMRGEISGKTIADLGCGTGILGIGCLMLGAREVYFVDNEPDALKLAEENIEKSGFKSKATVERTDIKKFNKKADVVIQNPPFGTKEKHADREFLEKAFQTADIIYSFHKTSTESFVKAIAADNGFRITDKLSFAMPLKKTMPFHKKKIERIDVSCYRMERITKK